jgi:hypothetical protein
MTVDDNPTEVKAMDLFRQGESTRASELQDEFLAEIKRSGLDHCTCPASASSTENALSVWPFIEATVIICRTAFRRW